MHLHTLSKYMYSHYVNCEDRNYFLANDVINDMTLTTLADPSAPPPGARSARDAGRPAQRLLSVLGCQDGYIRVVRGSDLYYEAALQGGVTVINNDYVYTDAQQQNSGACHDSSELIYGLETGAIGQMVLTNDAIRRGWIVDGAAGAGAGGAGLEDGAGPASRGSNGTVRSILSKLDVTRDGVNDVVVGRDDGTMEVYGFNFNGDPELIYSRNIGETVHTVDGGFITNDETEEIIAQTYSGKVLCFHQSNSDADKDSILAAPADAKSLQRKRDSEKALAALNREVGELERAVKKEQERYARISNNFLQTVASFHVKDKFVLNAGDGSYTLHLETTVPVVMLTIQTEVSIEIEDVMADYSGSIQCARAQGEGASARASYLTTYRCHVPMKRIELKIWIDEGDEGKINVFLIPSEKDTAGSVCTYKVLPLSLHKRVHNAAAGARGRDAPMSELTLRGQFIIAEAHAWIAVCVPELPTAPVDDRSIEYRFQGCSADTALEAYLEDGLIVLRSDSIPTLQTLKSYVVAEATAQHIKLGVQFSAHPEGLRCAPRARSSCFRGAPSARRRVRVRPPLTPGADPALAPRRRHFCESIWPRLSKQRRLERNMCMADGLLEIKRQEEDTAFLSKELVDIMEDAEKIRREYSEQPKYVARARLCVLPSRTPLVAHRLARKRNARAARDAAGLAVRILERLKKTVIDTYIIWHKLKGHNAEPSAKRVADSIPGLERAEDLLHLLSAC